MQSKLSNAVKTKRSKQPKYWLLTTFCFVLYVPPPMSPQVVALSGATRGGF